MRIAQQAAGHAQVDQQRAAGLEARDQVFAATVESRHPLALELDRDRKRILGPRQPRIGDLDALEPASLEVRRELAPNRLDLGQLGHGVTLAAERGMATPCGRA